MDKIYGFLSNEELNKWEKLPVVVNILTSKEFVSWLLRRDENRDKQNNSRPHGEITDEDIQNAIKQGYNDGYAMAKAKYERPQGKWIKIFENPFTNGYVCPFCNHKIQVTEQFLPQVTECESCGADMRGGAE